MPRPMRLRARRGCAGFRFERFRSCDISASYSTRTRWRTFLSIPASCGLSSCSAERPILPKPAPAACHGGARSARSGYASALFESSPSLVVSSAGGAASAAGSSSLWSTSLAWAAGTGSTCETVRPRIWATSSGRRKRWRPSTVALSMLIGFVVPRLFARMSRTPPSSRTARTPPPAMTPVPSLAGLAVADADAVDLVADHDERREREPPAALDDLGDPVDLDYALLELAFSFALDDFALYRCSAQNFSPPSRAASASAFTRP